MSARIKAVIFDLGDTLWFEAAPRPRDEVAAIQAERIAPLLHARGITPPRPLPHMVRDVWDACDAAYHVERDRGTFRDPSLAFLWRGAFAVHGIEIDGAFAESLWRTGWLPVRALGVQLYPDTLDVLRELKARRYAVCINTNRPCTTDMLQPDLADFGIAPYVDAAVCSGDAGWFKPHAAPFALALERLGVAPHQALMVGDGAAVDVAGAAALGIPAVWKLNGRYNLPPCPQAAYEVHDLSEILALPVLGGAGVAPADSLTPHDDRNADRY